MEIHRWERRATTLSGLASLTLNSDCVRISTPQMSSTLSSSSAHHWSASDFAAEARQLVDLTNGEWTWKTRRRRPGGGLDAGYLEAKPRIVRTPHPVRPAAHESDSDGAIEVAVEGYEEDADPSSLVVVPAGGGVSRHTCHICYSESFRVPMLLLDATDIDGTPLEASQVLQQLRHASGSIPLPAHAATDTSEEANWQFLTQVDHPHLNRPMFALHPCETASWMDTILRAGTTDAPSEHPTGEAQEEIGDLDSELAALQVASPSCTTKRGDSSNASTLQPPPSSVVAVPPTGPLPPLLTWLSLVAPIVGLPLAIHDHARSTSAVQSTSSQASN